MSCGGQVCGALIGPIGTFCRGDHTIVSDRPGKKFRPTIEWAHRLDNDIDTAELIGLDEATHWVMEDRPAAYRDELSDFLLETA